MGVGWGLMYCFMICDGSHDEKWIYIGVGLKCGLVSAVVRKIIVAIKCCFKRR